ncbi:hypothetical protein HDU79_000283 [Rhizoclosmatium sp. JEL0117]|nr:hypothetical protein HDU79_000283 [Rhizoclosmatium sp. JEL0117]
MRPDHLVLFVCYLVRIAALPAPQAPSYLSLLLIGDWGNQIDLSDEVNVATTMNSWAEKHSTSAVISLGDNFYKGGDYDYDGLSSPDDDKFHALWTNVYNGKALAKLPWWVILGNHDWLEPHSHKYELEYQHPRWNIPDLFYTKRVKIPNSKAYASFIFLETDLIQYGYNAYGNMSINFQHLGWRNETHTLEKQLAWLDNELYKANEDEFVFVLGHHGGFTCIEDMNESFAMANVTALVNKWNASAYIHGHHHTLAYYYTNGGNTLQVQSGSGGNADGACAPVSPDALGKEYANKYGFAHLRVHETYAQFDFVTEENEVVFDARVNKRVPVKGVKVDKKYLVDAKDPAVHFKKGKGKKGKGKGKKKVVIVESA